MRVQNGDVSLNVLVDGDDSAPPLLLMHGILASADSFEKVYGYSSADAAQAALVPFSQPGIVTIPLGFATLIVVSLLTRKRA